MKTGLALLVLVPLAMAEDAPPRLSLDFTDTTAGKVVTRIAKLTGTRVNLDPQYRDQPISLHIVNQPLDAAWAMVARTLRARVHKAPARTWIVPGWQLPLLRKLDSANAERITVFYDKVSSHDVMRGLAAYLDVNIVVDPEWTERQVTINATKLPGATFLDLALAPMPDAAWELRYGALYVATKTRLRALPRAIPDYGGKKDAKPIKPSLLKAAPRPLVEFAAQRLGLKLELTDDAEAALAKPTMTIEANEMRPNELLAAILIPRGLTANVADGALTIRRK